MPLLFDPFKHLESALETSLLLRNDVEIKGLISLLLRTLTKENCKSEQNFLTCGFTWPDSDSSLRNSYYNLPQGYALFIILLSNVVMLHYILRREALGQDCCLALVICSGSLYSTQSSNAALHRIRNKGTLDCLDTHISTIDCKL